MRLSGILGVGGSFDEEEAGEQGKRDLRKPVV
jgi:hypothetical protein